MMKIPTAENARRAMETPCGVDWNFGARVLADGESLFGVGVLLNQMIDGAGLG